MSPGNTCKSPREARILFEKVALLISSSFRFPSGTARRKTHKFYTQLSSLEAHITDIRETLSQIEAEIENDNRAISKKLPAEGALSCTSLGASSPDNLRAHSELSIQTKRTNFAALPTVPASRITRNVAGCQTNAVGLTSSNPSPTPVLPSTGPEDSESTQTVIKPASHAAYSESKKIDEAHSAALDDSLQFTCQVEALGERTTSTIATAIDKIGHEKVSTAGFLLLNVESLPSVDWTKVERDLNQARQHAIHDFQIKRGRVQGTACYEYANQNHVSFLDMTQVPVVDYGDPQQRFEGIIERPPNEYLPYYVGTPLDTLSSIDLVHPGEKLRSRGKDELPGINTPYWYISHCYGTGTSMHIEEGRTGSINLIIDGSPKDWLLIHPDDKEKLEVTLRKEFPGSRECAQFVRHLSVLLAPSWLQERNIRYSTFTQHAGQMMVTLPEVYHQVINRGRNIAVAINFELSEWPYEVKGYDWCTKQCGPAAIIESDFRFSRGLRQLCKPMEDGAVLYLSDDEPEKTVEKTVEKTAEKTVDFPLTFLPGKHADPRCDIDNMIQYAKQRIHPHLLGYNNAQELETSLKRFLPGEWLDDKVLRLLLQIIASDSNFKIIESIGLRLVPQPSEVSKHLNQLESDGLVFPFHVNEETPTNEAAIKNHWVLGILDLKSFSFISFGISEEVTRVWSTILGKCLEAEGRVKYEVRRPPQNRDNASCALVCCLALEWYLCTYPLTTQPDSLRSHYLRRLLQAVMNSNYFNELSRNRSGIFQLPTTPLFHGSSQTMEATSITCSRDALLLDIQASNRSDDLRYALDDETYELTLSEKARTLQLIMQCSFRGLDFLHTGAQEATVFNKEGSHEEGSHQVISFEELVEQLEKNTDRFDSAGIRQRILLIRIFKLFESEMGKERQLLIRNRKISKRSKESSGIKRKTCQTRVLERLEQLPKLKKRIRYLIQLENQYMCDFALPFTQARESMGTLKRPIAAYLYDTLSRNESRTGYFLKWFPILRPDLTCLNELDYRALSRLW